MTSSGGRTGLPLFQAVWVHCACELRRRSRAGPPRETWEGEVWAPGRLHRCWQLGFLDLISWALSFQQFSSPLCPSVCLVSAGGIPSLSVASTTLGGSWERGQEPQRAEAREGGDPVSRRLWPEPSLFALLDET